MTERNWQPAFTASLPGRWLAPEDVEVWTKIHDAGGERNVQLMTRRGNLWWVGLGKENPMYVYYNPTHWAPI